LEARFLAEGAGDRKAAHAVARRIDLIASAPKHEAFPSAPILALDG